MCGGTTLYNDKLIYQQGLSPRVRGNLPNRFLPLNRSRSIPACAGEPHDAPSLCLPLGVYPRVCGGTYRLSRYAAKLRGLSPRVRGNPYGQIG